MIKQFIDTEAYGGACELYRGSVNVNKEMKYFTVKHFVGTHLDSKYFFCFLDR